LLGHVEPKRLDDGQPHQVRIVYLLMTSDDL